jgi:hypothetical protein
MNVPIRIFTNIDIRGTPLDNDVTVQTLRMQWAADRIQSYIRIRWNQHFVFDLTAIRIRSVQQMGLEHHAIAALILVDLYFVRFENRHDTNSFGGTSLDRNRTVLIINGDAGVVADFEMVFFPGFSKCECCRSDKDHHHQKFYVTSTAPHFRSPRFQQLPVT